MVICVCGMIGSGKTEYAKSQGAVISDFDAIGSKEEQIKYTLNAEKKLGKVYHTTCFPTLREQKAFEKMEVRYIWINTGFAQCRENILKRNRLRDVKNIKETLAKNKEIYEKYRCSRIPFKVVNIFDKGERW